MKHKLEKKCRNCIHGSFQLCTLALEFIDDATMKVLDKDQNNFLWNSNIDIRVNRLKNNPECKYFEWRRGNG